MDTIKHAVGDEVWVGHVTWSAIEEQCPDCLGTARWHVVLPNGEQFDAECPRCYPGGTARSTGRVREHWEYRPNVYRGTINGVQLDSTRPEGDQVRYPLLGQYAPGLGGTLQPAKDVYGTKAGALEKCTADAERLRREKDDGEAAAAKRKRGKGARSAADGPSSLRSVAYARSQVRKARHEEDRWTAYALTKGAVIAPRPGALAGPPDPTRRVEPGGGARGEGAA